MLIDKDELVRIEGSVKTVEGLSLNVSNIKLDSYGEGTDYRSKKYRIESSDNVDHQISIKYLNSKGKDGRLNVSGKYDKVILDGDDVGSVLFGLYWDFRKHVITVVFGALAAIGLSVYSLNKYFNNE